MTVEEQIAELGLAPDHAEVLLRLVSRRSLETAREAGYISLRPQERHIAAYFNKRFLDIATPPEESAGAAHRHPGTRVRRVTTATHMLRVPPDTVAHDELVALVERALDWRESGHHWGGTSTQGGASDLAGETCASCFLVVPKTGVCDCQTE